jgi:ABC-type sulfate/molybdate transport systems ATPase subunit
MLDVELDADGPVAIAGPSGAGKSTILRLIAGLDRPASGIVDAGGERWFGPGIDVPAEQRRVGYVFQEYALFPHLTVRRNVEFGAEGRDVGPLLDRLGIGPLAEARPDSLSGGERQRVAVARALARQPKLLLLDEPLAALDPATRGAVAAELAGVLREAGVPALVVTHSFEEAASVTSEIVIVERGRVAQCGTARDLLHRPASPFVARFAGCNTLSGTAEGSMVTLERGGVVRAARPADGRVAVLVAPWDIAVSLTEPQQDSSVNHLRGTVEQIVPLGDRVRIVVAGVTAEVTAEVAVSLGLGQGSAAVISWPAAATRVLAADGAPADR